MAPNGGFPFGVLVKFETNPQKKAACENTNVNKRKLFSKENKKKAMLTLAEKDNMGILTQKTHNM